jgi:hypothetical protein
LFILRVLRGFFGNFLDISPSRNYVKILLRNSNDKEIRLVSKKEIVKQISEMRAGCGENSNFKNVSFPLPRTAKRWIILLAVGLLGGSSMGCMTTPWSPDPTIRAQQSVLVSEQIRMSGNDLSALSLLQQ